MVAASFPVHIVCLLCCGWFRFLSLSVGGVVLACTLWFGSHIWCCVWCCVETYYCLWQAVGDDLMFEVEVIDPKDNQGDVEQEER